MKSQKKHQVTLHELKILASKADSRIRMIFCAKHALHIIFQMISPHAHSGCHGTYRGIIMMGKRCSRVLLSTGELGTWWMDLYWVAAEEESKTMASSCCWYRERFRSVRTITKGKEGRTKQEWNVEEYAKKSPWNPTLEGLERKL